MSIFKFLHLMLITKVYPHLFYWAWRARAYCSAFLCFLFIIPPIATFLWLFVEEQNSTWETLTHTFTLTSTALHTYTDLKNLNVIYSHALAAVFFVPVLIILLTSQCVFFLLPIVAVFAWDSVTSHGGELSDTEFHESRCNYWRKDVEDYHQKLIDEAEYLEHMRPWLKNHPDKGRSDGAALFIDQSLPHPLGYIFSILIGLPLDLLWAFLWSSSQSFFPWAIAACKCLYKNVTNSVLWKSVVSVISFFYSVVYGIIGAPIASLRATIRFAIHDFLDTFPFLREWYAAIAEGLAFVRAEIIDVSSTLWLHIKSNFYKIYYWPQFLTDAFEYMLVEHTGYTLFCVAAMIATALYFISVFVLLLPWKRVYGKSVHRPPIYPYLIALIPVIYVFAVLWQNLKPWYGDSYLLLNMGDDLLHFYSRYFANTRDLFFNMTYLLPADHPYLYAAFVYFIFNFFRQLRRRRIARRHAYYNRPAVFRSYYNYWLRGMSVFEDEFRMELAEELSPFSTTVAAYDTISQESKEETAIEDAEDKEEADRMIWMRITYVPTFYDPHPNLKYRKGPWPFAYVVEDHYKNPHHMI